MASKNKTEPEPNLGHIAQDLRPLAFPIGQLEHDPANERRHGERNLREIKASLKRFGQRKPIVVHADTHVVLAGNGTLEAARSLGWAHIAIVRVQDDPTTAASYAIADNRTAELAEWDSKALADLLKSFGDNGLPGEQDLEGVGYSVQEFDALVASLEPAFTPNTNPDMANNPVSEDDLRDAQQDLDGQFQGEAAAKLEVCCPDCGCVFKIDTP